MLGGFTPSWDDCDSVKAKVGYILFCTLITIAILCYPFIWLSDRFRKPEKRVLG